MTRQSRPRLGTTRRARRTWLYVIPLLLAAGGVWFVQEKFGFVAAIRDKAASLTSLVAEFSVPRGTIFDRNLKQLAVSLDRVSVYARLRELESIPGTVKVLGEILSLDEQELQQSLQRSMEADRTRVWIAGDISLEQEIAIKSRRLAGITMQREEKRFYPNGSQAAHIIGYADNGIGLAGVEHYYDKVMAGGGKAQDDGDGRTSSHDLVLTLDLKVQEILDTILAEATRNERVINAVACITEARSGEIIAASQVPGFDPNEFAKFSKEVLANRLVAAVPLSQGLRFLLRDVALLANGGGEEGRLPWSVRAVAGGLGNQVRLWDRLRLNERPFTDFHAGFLPGEPQESLNRAVAPQDPSLAMVPESASPLNIVAAIAGLHEEGAVAWPHVVRGRGGAPENLAMDQGPKGRAGGDAAASGGFVVEDAVELFRSRARPGPARSSFFHDQLAVGREIAGKSQLVLQELLLVTIPAGGSDLVLLLLVEGKPQGAAPKSGVTPLIAERVVEERVERISILQQVAKSVADVVEAEAGADVNYQEEKEQEQVARRSGGERVARPLVTVMPDLRGQSLRKGLRLLQGVQAKIVINGTGRIVSQKPSPGSSLSGVGEVALILEKPEMVTPEVLAKKAASGR